MVKDIIPRTEDAKSFRFPRPAELEFRPGQYLILTIKDRSRGEALSKSFTISSSPTEHDYIEVTKRITSSRFSAILSSLRIGDRVKIDAPYGDFIFEGGYEKIAAITGGIGITPLMSICEYCTDLRANTDITLLYSNRRADSIPFRKELSEMQQRNGRLRVVFTITGADQNWNGHIGRINSEMVRREIPDFEERLFFVCGPLSMVSSMVELLTSMGLPSLQIKQELFTGFVEPAQR
jgi:ferredoxin-NADP reductase